MAATRMSQSRDAADHAGHDADSHTFGFCCKQPLTAISAQWGLSSCEVGCTARGRGALRRLAAGKGRGRRALSSQRWDECSGDDDEVRGCVECGSVCVAAVLTVDCGCEHLSDGLQWRSRDAALRQ